MSRSGLRWGWFLTLWVAWLLLHGQASVGSALLGVIVAWGVVAWLVPGLPSKRIRPWVLIRLGARVLIDIVASNLSVAWLVMTRPSRTRPAWVSVPLELPDDIRVVMLAAIVTLTPGTLSVEYDAEHASLLVHVLDTAEPAAVAAEIKTRYESLLLELYA
ncbi:Na+/H+ antiporter subunit E [Niveibacterium sp. 24ML]|uniref:Na+/H+ antiporter subunit E n=1 Tax=Niveibacterium sp. 24ML TaxID=2985512 RepID=UPI00226E7510|nr:Na+/H+ antiporter subunit E [Niveibacterium sp. 24ML]MCX9157977.1 Na+/H+ antiporter subunit E [Niveibacterium sp. 24ML]